MSFKTKQIQELYKKHINACLEELSEIGEGLIQDAYYGADFRDRTYNLRDSYGYGVYFKGELQRKGFIGSAKATETREGKSGRPEIESYLSGYKANPNTWELIIVAAMWYAEDLEKGWTPTQKIYKVVSGIGDDIYALKAKYKGTVKQL